MRFLILAAAGAAFLAAGAVAAEDKKPEDADKTICKRMADSASRLGRKVCKTRAEWKAEQEQENAGVDGTYRPIQSRN